MVVCQIVQNSTRSLVYNYTTQANSLDPMVLQTQVAPFFCALTFEDLLFLNY